MIDNAIIDMTDKAEWRYPRLKVSHNLSCAATYKHTPTNLSWLYMQIKQNMQLKKKATADNEV